jgi:branched-chain amino acid transport system substrate-binding protein
MKKLLGICILALVVLLVALVPACGKGEEKPIPTPQAKTLKIGFLGALSGPAAPWSIEHQRGAMWAIEKLNAAGGVKVGADRYMITVESCDDKATGSEATVCAQQFVSEGIHYVIGPLATTKAVQPIFEPAKVLHFPIEWAESTLGPEHIWTVNASACAQTWQSAFADQLFSVYPQLKTMSLVSPDSEYGRQGATWSKNACVAHGAVVVGEEYYATGTVDFYPVLTKLLGRNPDFLNTGNCAPGDTALIVKQARELGYKGTIFSPSSCPVPVMLEVAGAQAAEGWIGNEADWSDPGLPKELRDLNAAFQTRFPGVPWSVATGLGHGSVELLTAALERAGSIDPDAVRAVIDSADFTYTWQGMQSHLGGLQTFGVRREVQMFQPMHVLHNGKPEVKSYRLIDTP